LVGADGTPVCRVESKNYRLSPEIVQGHFLVRCTVKRKVRGQFPWSQNRINCLCNLVRFRRSFAAFSYRTLVLQFPHPSPFAWLHQTGLKGNIPPSQKELTLQSTLFWRYL